MKVPGKFRTPDSHRERGVTMVLVAVAMVAIIAMAAMSIDLVTLYLAREEAQRAADAAALAAARVISVSGITAAGDPTGANTANWRSLCGSASGWATQAATAAAGQNSVRGQAGTLVSIAYSDGSNSNSDCSVLSATFAVNPMVTVQVQQASIPSFFSRIWGIAGNRISASATAEVFNPSASGANGVVGSTSVTPVQPRCVKPWIVPNLDPGASAAPFTFVNVADGSISHPGITLNGTPIGVVIGERFNLFPDCTSTAGSCSLASSTPPNTPMANAMIGSVNGVSPINGTNLEYLPGAVAASSQAIPSCAASGTNYEMAVAGCDQTTAYQCGVQSSISGNPNMVDLTENPSGASGDTALGLSCSLTTVNYPTIPLIGQDQLRTVSYPFVAIAGDANPLGIGGTPITSSNSIVTLPIYDQTAGPIGPVTTPVTIVGFLQVFVELVNTDGSLTVTVMNVAGCGNAATNLPVFGSSPVPIRLITPH
jgi:Flp pilus assembly protein TadG